MDDETKRSFEIIGRFLSNCGTFEYSINDMLRQQFRSASLIDKLEQLPVLERWKITKESVDECLLKEMDDFGYSISEKIEEIDSILAYYNDTIKPIRDLLSHSPLVQFKDSKPQIINSRRHKYKERDALELEKVEATFHKFEENLDKLQDFSFNFGFNGLGWRKIETNDDVCDE